MTQFCNLHRHGMYSFDGVGKPIQAARYAKFIGQTALGLTDHGNVCGLLDHYKACQQEGIKPVLGVEVYHQRVFDRPKEGEQRKVQRSHLTLLAQDKEGYENLLRMTTAANADQFYYYPIVTDKLLDLYGDGVIVLSGCTSGYLAKKIIASYTTPDGDGAILAELNDASTFLDFLRYRFGDRLFLEVQPFPAPYQKEVNQYMLRWGQLYDIPVVMTADSHFVSPEGYATYLVAQKIRRPSQEILVDYSQRYLASTQDMEKAWFALMGEYGYPYLDTSQHIADRCDVKFTMRYAMPKLDWVTNENEALSSVAIAGLKAKKLFKTVNGKGEIFPAYHQRIKYEIATFLDKNFAGYMLLCADIAKFCKDNNILCQARGSACGSLWTYLAGISLVDPIKYGTSFERFCSPDRYDVPDIDLDVEDSRKEEVVQYLLTKYQGAQIITFGQFKTKLLINKLIDALDFENGDAQLFRSEMLSIMGDIEGDYFTCQMVLDASKILQGLDKRYQCVTHFFGLYGQNQYVGKHPAGVAIHDGPLSDRVAIMRAGESLVTSYDMAALTTACVTKVDILGVANLNIVKEAEMDAGVSFQDSWCHDAKVLEAFAQGLTLGIFQKERKTPRNMLKQIAKARGGKLVFSDLVFVDACNRPAPLLEGTFDQYIAGIEGKSTKTLWYDYTQETYGAILYQEDIISICRELADLSWQQVSQVLKSLKRYNSNDADLEEVFVTGMVSKSFPETEARSLWQTMRRYLFNKSHAVSYAMLGAREMWLKLYHPFSFYLALLNNEDDKRMRQSYMADGIKHHGLSFMVPHVNGSIGFGRVDVRGHKYIQEGLTAVDGVGSTVAQAILQEREENGDYTSKENFLARVPKRQVNIRVQNALESSGALEFDPTKFLYRVRAYNLELCNISSYGI